MYYDNTSGRLCLSAEEAISLSLAHLSRENGAEDADLFPQPVDPPLRQRLLGDTEPLTLSLLREAEGIGFLISVGVDREDGDGILLLRRLSCPPEAPSQRVLRRLRGEAYLCAAALFSRRPDADSLCIRFFLLGPHNDLPVSSEETVRRGAVDAFLARLLPCLTRFAAEEADRVRRRLPSFRSLRFPFPEVRSSQRRMMEAFYTAIRRHQRLFACAPTGTGKTAAALYPALRALGEGLAERIFYLTPTGTASAVAATAAHTFADNGALLRAALLTAKERICPSGMLCRDPMTPCPLGRVPGKQTDAAVDALLREQLPLASDGDFRRIAHTFGVCPYALMLRYTAFCDLIIGDYNYLFDPHVALRRFFGRPGKYILLVDEAHDLPDRIRRIASADLSTQTLSPFLTLLGEADDDSAKAAERLRSTFGLVTAPDPDADRPLRAPGAGNGFFRTEEHPPAALLAALRDALRAADALCANRALPFRKRCAIRDAARPLRDFLQVAAHYDRHYETFCERRGTQDLVRLLCLHPAAIADRCLSCCDSALLFSATLLPLSYYRAVLGDARDSTELLLDSPFASEQLCICLMDRISTRYEDRESSAAEIARAIAAMTDGKTGNYFVFCPSYAYLSTLYRAFCDAFPDRLAQMQPASADPKARQDFLAGFSENPARTRIGFCVTGGVFSEGIDLAGSRLIGAAVVGVGLPSPSPERDAIAAYYQEIYEQGREFAYLYPGMNRVLQAAGRVIRSEQDRGVLVLIDDRFRLPLYRRMLPSLWKGITCVGNPDALRFVVQRFWKGSG